MTDSPTGTTPLSLLTECAGAPIVGKLRNAEIAIARVGFGHEHDHLHVSMDRQDTYYVMLQLRDCPAHEHWENGRPAPAPASPRGSLHIIDLNTAPSAILTGRLDSLKMAITRSFLDELAEDGGFAPVSSLAVPNAWTTQDTILSSLVPAFLAALDERESVSSLFIDHLTTAAGLHIARRYGALRQRIVQTGALAPWQERRAREIIADDLRTNMSLAEVAVECGLSVSHFSRAFKVSVGMTPHRWLQINRIARAKDLLKRPAMSLAEIAIRCGFADQSHFSRAFKRATGLTPGAWRRSLRS